MSVHCEKCGQAFYLPALTKELEDRIDKALRYCAIHTHQMWAASVVAALLNCDFRDAEAELKKVLDSKPEAK